MIFLADLNKKTYFKFWRPISREPNNLGKQKKKKQIEAKRCIFRVQPLLEFTNMHFHNILFSSFRSRKKRKETTQLAKETWNI